MGWREGNASRRQLIAKIQDQAATIQSLRLQISMLEERLKRDPGGAGVAEVAAEVGEGTYNEPRFLVNAVEAADVTPKELCYEARQGLGCLLQIPPGLLPGRLVRFVEDKAKGSWPVYRRSGLRMLVQEFHNAGAVDPERIPVQVVMRAMDVVETIFHPIPPDVAMGLVRKKAKQTFLDREPECVS